MNPVTRALLGRVANRRLANFVSRWDALESLVIRVYKSGEASDVDVKEYAKLRRWLAKRYTRWSRDLATHWRATEVNGELLTEDPFATILATEAAHDFADNWPAMQTLPAAREALNGWLAGMLHD